MPSTASRPPDVEAEQGGLVFGPGARNRLRRVTIPDTLPGIGDVRLDGVTEPVRVRFSHITDPHIATPVADRDLWDLPASDPDTAA